MFCRKILLNRNILHLVLHCFYRQTPKDVLPKRLQGIFLFLEIQILFLSDLIFLCFASSHRLPSFLRESIECHLSTKVRLFYQSQTAMKSYLRLLQKMVPVFRLSFYFLFLNREVHHIPARIFHWPRAMCCRLLKYSHAVLTMRNLIGIELLPERIIPCLYKSANKKVWL